MQLHGEWCWVISRVTKLDQLELLGERMSPCSFAKLGVATLWDLRLGGQG